MNYLCEAHRLWLANNPLAANHHYHETMDLAIHLLESQQFEKSLAYLGSAHETAELLLNDELMQHKFICEFKTSLVMLSSTLMRVGQYQQANLALEKGMQKYSHLLNQNVSPAQRQRILETHENLAQGHQHCQMMWRLAEANTEATNVDRVDYETKYLAQQPHFSLH